MYQPVKIGFGEFLGRFFATGIVPNTKALGEYVKRPLTQAILWAPGRLVDLAEEMLAAWQRDDSRGAPTPAYTMPILLCALAKDTALSAPDFHRALATPEYIVIDGDPKDRLFLIRTLSTDIRAQIVIAAHDEPTARALAAQLLLWLEALPNRRFAAVYRFCGIDNRWPVQIVMPDMPASLVPQDSKNVSMLTLDLTLRATVPLYQSPKAGEPNDGQGDPDDPENPAGYPYIVQVNNNGHAITDP